MPSSRTFFVGETSTPMDPNIHDTFNTLIGNIEKMDQQLQEIRDQVDVYCRDIAIRLDRLETNRRRATKEENSRNDSSSPRRERVQTYNTADADAQYVKSVKVDTSSFDERLDPQVYIHLTVGYGSLFPLA